jgi:hypothetical protein
MNKGQGKRFWTKAMNRSKQRPTSQEKGATVMKRILVATVALAILAVFLSSAQAVIKIEVAEVQNGVAFIKGNGAQLGAQITWEGGLVTTANKKNGGFRSSACCRAIALGN